MSSSDQAPIQLTNVYFFRGPARGMRHMCMTADLRLAPGLTKLEGRIGRLQGWAARSFPGLEDGTAEQEGGGAGGFPGAFAQLIVDIAAWLQRVAGLPGARGRAEASAADSWRLWVPYHDRAIAYKALSLAASLAWQGVLALDPDKAARAASRVEEILGGWRGAVAGLGMLPNTLRFIHAAERLGVPWSGVTREIFQFGHGARARRLYGSFTDHTSTLAVQVAKQKSAASRLLRAMGVPVPRQRAVRTLDECQAAAGQLGFPVVVKPASRDQGIGVVTNITSLAELGAAFAEARRLGPTVLVEKHVDGDDHRLLVVDGRMLVATRRIPGGVTGDGRRTVVELVEGVNADPARVNDKRGLIRLVLNEEAQALLSRQGLSQSDVPEAGRFVRLRYTANISTGGVPEDVTAKVHPDNRLLVERVARIVGLDIAGVDLLIADIGRSWREIGGAVCEVNAQPGLRVHWSSGLAWDLNERILAGLLGGGNGRIPITAVTGTNGKSTVCQMVHAIWRTAGKVSGLTTTQGVWIGEELVSTDNLSGFPGGRLVLADPKVEAAVIEMPRKGLIKFGFPFERCSVAALLNVQDDHLGLDGIHSLDEMARLKSEVLARASDAVVVNAEDFRCVAALDQATAPRRILFARDGGNSVLASHRAAGGEAVLLEEREGVRWIVMAEGARAMPLMPVGEIPATMDGRLPFNEVNALCAAALAWAHGVPLDVIRRALGRVSNTVEQNPGRYNFFPGLPFQVLLDYAHNPEGVLGLGAVAGGLPVVGKRRLVCVNLGNRGKAHIRTCAPFLKDYFDDFILSQDLSRVLRCSDYAGDDPSGAMLRFFEGQMQAAGVPGDCVVVERDPAAAIRQGLNRAQPGDLLVLMADYEMAVPMLDSMAGALRTSGVSSQMDMPVGASGQCQD